MAKVATQIPLPIIVPVAKPYWAQLDSIGFNLQVQDGPLGSKASLWERCNLCDGIDDKCTCDHGWIPAESQ